MRLLGTWGYLEIIYHSKHALSYIVSICLQFVALEYSGDISAGDISGGIYCGAHHFVLIHASMRLCSNFCSLS